MINIHILFSVLILVTIHEAFLGSGSLPCWYFIFKKKLFWDFLFFLYFAQTNQLGSNRLHVEKWTSWPFMVISWVTFKNDGLSITSFWDECVCACLCVCARLHVYHPLFKTSRQLWLLIHILGDRMWSLRDSAMGQRNLWPRRVYLSGRSVVFPHLAFPGCTSQPWTQLCLRAWSTLCHMRLPAGVKRPPCVNWISEPCLGIHP